MPRLFVIPLGVHDAEIAAWCWGPGCGKGEIGGVDLGEYGSGVPCHEENCPHLDRQLEEPTGTVGDPPEPVFLRKLKSVGGA